MFSMRVIIFSLIAVFALFLGMVFAFPAEDGDFAKVEFNRFALLAEVADSPRLRMQGLSKKNILPESHAMLFLFEDADRHAIWMKDMNFPIDIFWIRDGKVVDIEENASAPLMSNDTRLPAYVPDVPADSVLETRAGVAEKYGIKIGDGVRISIHGADVHIAERSNIVSGESPFPGEEYYIDTLRRTLVQGRDFTIGNLLQETPEYKKYAVSYRVGAVQLAGVINIPSVTPPNTGFPVLILNHGLIDPKIYYTGRGSKREQDFFTRHDYITVHPDYRGYASSSPRTNTHHDFYVGYTEDVIGLIDALREYRAKKPLIDTERIGMWGHSMGGGIASRIMVLRPEIRAYVLFAPISAEAEDNFYELSEEERAWLAETYGTIDAGRAVYEKISPLTYFKNITSPVQLHHGTGDKAVPIRFSEKMYDALMSNKKKAEFFIYPDESHEFIKDWPLAIERSLQFFDRYVKDAR